MIKKILALAREDIVKMSAYSNAKLETECKGILLNANENPFGIEGLNRYPEPQPTSLLKLFRKLYQVNEEEILITRGSDEGIDLLLRVFCEAGKDSIMTCPPTYGMYEVAAIIQGAKIIRTPLNKDSCDLDVKKICERWQSNTKIIFLCSPNNPTGNLLPQDRIIELSKILSGKCLIVVDEAYIDFSSQPSMSNFIKSYPNIIVLRTLSKAYGLAGVRCGALLATPDIIELLKKVIAPYPIPTPTVKAILRAWSNKYLNQIKEEIDLIKREKKALVDYLQGLSFVKKVYPSDANFILIEVSNGKSLLKQCYKRKIIVRDRSQCDGLGDCVRISIGTPNENQKLREVLSDVKL